MKTNLVYSTFVPTLNVMQILRDCRSANQRVHRSDGFTLLETMIALALVSALVYASLFISGESSRATSGAIRQNQSQAVLQNFAEETLGNVAINPNLSTTGTHPPQYFDQQGKLVSSGPLELSWEVTPNSPIANVIKIEMFARWPSSFERDRTLTIYRAAPPDPVLTGIALIPLPVPPPNHIFSWQYSAWTDCDVASHTSTRVKTCYDETDGQVMGTSAPCSALPSSPVISSCGYNSWAIGDWSSCSGGMRNRSVDCVDGSGTKVSDSSCSMFTRPQPSQSCVICNPYC